MDTYNKVLFDQLAESNLAFGASTSGKVTKLALYTKRAGNVDSPDDVAVLGYAYAIKVDDGLYSMDSTVAVPKLGNILYAMTAMYLNGKGARICANREGDLRDDAHNLWEVINSNSNYQKSKLPPEQSCDFYEETRKEDAHPDNYSDIDTMDFIRDSFLNVPVEQYNPLNSAFTVEPDERFRMALEAHQSNDIHCEVFSDILAVGGIMFENAYEDEFELDYEERISLSENNFSKLKVMQFKQPPASPDLTFKDKLEQSIEGLANDAVGAHGSALKATNSKSLRM
ncbi:hypothetical protein VCHA53O466_140021 [Vibrio chagasii]|nr:hypothetical protein VCHA53O466_140021 [Vibrio chagasii]